MNSKFLIVSKKILPDVFDKVIEARDCINSGEAKGVSDAVKMVGISRSTYYKYKDYVFPVKDDSIAQNAVIGLMLKHRKGILSEVLNILSNKNVNVLTVNQSLPISGKASVNISIDISEMDISIDELIDELKENDGISYINLLSIE